MACFVKIRQLAGVSVYAILIAISFPAAAQDQSGQGGSVSRGVRIIAAPTPETNDPSQLNPSGIATVDPAPLTPVQPSPRLDAPGPTAPSASVLLVPPASQPDLSTTNPAPAILTPAPAPSPTDASTPTTPTSVPSNAAFGNNTGAPKRVPLLQPGPSSTPNQAAPSSPTPGASDFANAPNQPDSGLYPPR